MAYHRFLTNKDYCSIATEEHMEQVIRDVPERIAQAEQRAEMNFLEHLDQYYEIERVLAVGKNIREYNVAVTYPGQCWIKKDETIYKTLTAINGYKKPTKTTYWKQVVDFIDPCLIERAKKYSQLRMYAKGEVVKFGTEYWICVTPHGYDTEEIHIPGINAWSEAEIIPWEPLLEWSKNDVCSYEGKFYQYLLDPVEKEPGNNENAEGNNTDTSNTDEENEIAAINEIDEEEDNETSPTPPTSNEPNETEPQTPSMLTPDVDDAWGLIGDYSQELEYDFEAELKDYVVFEDTVFYPVINPNADELMPGVNITIDDPRNQNIVAHMSRIALYYLHQIISPTNISETRRWAFEDSMAWLHDASRFKINPQLPRKCEHETGEKKVDWALATFQKSFDPYENMWLI